MAFSVALPPEQVAMYNANTTAMQALTVELKRANDRADADAAKAKQSLTSHP